MALSSGLGIGSGLQLDDMLTRLVSIEAQPLVALQKKEAAVQSQISALGTVKSALTTYQTALNAITAAKFNTVKGVSSDTGVATVTVAAGTKASTAELEVTALAKAAKIASGALTGTDGKTATTTSVIGTGTLTFTFGTATNDPDAVPPNAFTADADREPFTVDISADNNTLAGISEAINAADGPVTASIVNDGSGARLVLTSKETGAVNNFRLSGENADGSTTGGLAQLNFNPADPTANGGRQVTLGSDAKFSLDGIAITNKSNTIKDALDGVTITLVKEGTSRLYTTTDSSSAKSALTSFATAYNAMLSSIQALTKSTPQEAGSDDARTDGPLSGDAATRSILSRLANEITRPLAGATGAYTSLASLGLAFNDDGTLQLDDAVFSKAMADNPDAVAKLFTDAPFGEGTQSLTQRTSAIIDSFTRTGGSIATQISGLNTTTKDLQGQQDALQLRVTAIEARYRAQFTALDTMLTSMQSTSNFLSQQLDALANLRGGNR